MTTAPSAAHQPAMPSLVTGGRPTVAPAAVTPATALTLPDVYRDHWEFVWRSLRALGVRAADLEDQTHEVFLVVHRKLAEFEGRARLTTWLFAIASRVASDWRRRAHVRREHVTDDLPEPCSTQPGPDIGVERRQAVAALETILEAMPDEQRVVFALFELDGLPAEEIAPLVGCPINTVYSRLRLGRRHFERAAARLRARGAR